MAETKKVEQSSQEMDALKLLAGLSEALKAGEKAAAADKKPGPEVNKIYPKSEWVYVSIPAHTMLGDKHPGIRLNGVFYQSGQKHFVPPDVAETMGIILRRADQADIRLFSQESDAIAQALIERRYGGPEMTVGAATPAPDVAPR